MEEEGLTRSRKKISHKEARSTRGDRGLASWDLLVWSDPLDNLNGIVLIGD